MGILFLIKKQLFLFLIIPSLFLMNETSAVSIKATPIPSAHPRSEQEIIQTFEKSKKQLESLSGPVCEASPKVPSERILIGLIIQSGTGGPILQKEESLKFGLSDTRSKIIGSFDPKKESLVDRLKSIVNEYPHPYEDPDIYEYQVAADLLLKGAGSFYGSSESTRQDSVHAAEWFSSEIQNLRVQGIAQTEEQTQNLIAMMMDEMYSNYNDALNPDSPGGDNKPRNIASMGAGYQNYLNDDFESNDQGGVCDHIAAAGCQLWNKLYPGKPCYIVNIPGPGLQHWYTAIGNADGTYTLMDAGWRQKMAADGNPVSAAGNPQLFVPIAKVNESGDATIVATPPSELMNYIRSISRPNTEDGQLFRGMSQAGFATFKLGKKPNRPLVITLGGGRGRLSNQNLGEQVWGIFANIDQTKKFTENKLTLFYTQVVGTLEGKYQVAGIDNTFSFFYAIPVIKNIKIDFRAGMNLAAGGMIPEGPITSAMDIGYTGGAKIFAQTALNGEKKIDPKTKIAASVIFRAEGLPGIVITQMHGVDNGYGFKDGFKGFPTAFKNRSQIQILRQTEKGLYSAGIQGGASYGPLNYPGQPDWNLGANFSFLNQKQKGYQGINTDVNVSQFNTLFNSGTVAKMSAGTTFSVSSKKSERITLFTPSLSAQLSNYSGEIQFFSGAGLLIQFDKKSENKKPR